MIESSLSNGGTHVRAFGHIAWLFRPPANERFPIVPLLLHVAMCWCCHEGPNRGKLVLCQPSIDGLVGQVVNLSLDRMPSCPTYQTNIDRALGAD
jgi:hypothetical protein